MLKACIFISLLVSWGEGEGITVAILKMTITCSDSLCDHSMVCSIIHTTETALYGDSIVSLIISSNMWPRRKEYDNAIKGQPLRKLIKFYSSRDVPCQIMHTCTLTQTLPTNRIVYTSGYAIQLYYLKGNATSPVLLTNKIGCVPNDLRN